MVLLGVLCVMAGQVAPPMPIPPPPSLFAYDVSAGGKKVGLAFVADSVSVVGFSEPLGTWIRLDDLFHRAVTLERGLKVDLYNGAREGPMTLSIQLGRAFLMKDDGPALYGTPEVCEALTHAKTKISHPQQFSNAAQLHEAIPQAFPERPSTTLVHWSYVTDALTPCAALEPPAKRPSARTFTSVNAYLRAVDAAKH